jgi:hypothetical protein
MKTSNNQVQATADCALLFVLCQVPALLTQSVMRINERLC